MEDTASKEVVKSSTTDIDDSHTPWYCCLEEGIRVFLRCLGFENHEAMKSGEKKEGVVMDSSSSASWGKGGENCKVNEPSVGGGATDQAASTTDPDAADSTFTADPALGSPAISVEDSAITAARRPSRPPINSGSGPQNN